MRLQLDLPVKVMEQLGALARAEHRDMRQQAEFYVCRAVQQDLRQRTLEATHTHALSEEPDHAEATR